MSKLSLSKSLINIHGTNKVSSSKTHRYRENACHNRMWQLDIKIRRRKKLDSEASRAPTTSEWRWSAKFFIARVLRENEKWVFSSRWRNKINLLLFFCSNHICDKEERNWSPIHSFFFNAQIFQNKVRLFFNIRKMKGNFTFLVLAKFQTVKFLKYLTLKQLMGL